MLGTIGGAGLLTLRSDPSPRLRVLRIRRSVIAFAFVLAIAAPTSAFAATAGVVAAVPALPVGGALAIWSIVLSGVVGAWARRHARARNPSRALFAVGIALIAILGASLAMELS